MGNNIPTPQAKKEEVIRTWSNGNRTYKQVSMLTGVPASTVRLIIDNYIKEQLKPLKVKLSRGIQLNMGI